MTSAVLVQEQAPKVRAEASQGVRILSVDAKIDGISLSKADRQPQGKDSKPFDFDVELSETAWTQDSLNLRYRFTFGVPSSGQVCRVGGSADVRFSQFNPDEDLQALGQDVANEMVVEIFRKNYEAVYLLHQALGMKPPTPWITQDVSISSRCQTE
jgi:hypothetical protein